MNREEPTLLKKLNLFDSISLIVGTGSFIVPGLIAGYLDSPALIFFVWICSGLLTLFGAFTFIELAAAFPQTGGIYIYLKKAFGPFWGFLFGWGSLFILRSGSIAGVAIGFALYVRYFLPLSNFGVSVVTSLVIIIFTIINFLGIRTGSRVQNLFTSSKVIALYLIGVAAFLLRLCGVGLFALIKKKPGLKKPLKTIGYPVIPALFLLLTTGIVINTLFTQPQKSLIGKETVLSFQTPHYGEEISIFLIQVK